MSALARAASSSGTLAYGSRADVPYGCGNVCAQAVLASTDPRTGKPAYAVRIANNSQHALRAVVRFGHRGRAPASELDVAPFSIVDALVPHGALTRPDDRAIVEVRGTNLAFTIDAPPALSTARVTFRRTTTIASIIAASASATLAFAMFFVAHATAPRTVPITTASPLEHTQAKPVAKAAAPKNFVHVGSSKVVAGGTIAVAYLPSSHGDVWLLDDHGRVWAHGRTNDGGRTNLAVPETAAGRDLRVVVGTTMNGELKQIASTVAILPDTANLAPQDQTAPKSDVTVASTTVASGKLVTIRFKSHHGEALLSLTDQGGSILEQTDVSADAPTASLRAPAAGSPATYDIVATITKGNAQDQSIIPIVVTP